MRSRLAYISAMVASLLASGSALNAQDRFRDVAEKADVLCQEYRFTEAAEICDQALREATMDTTGTAAADSLSISRLEESRNMARNGQNMLRYCSNPKVVAKKTLPLNEFFLYYPFAEGSWRQTPNVFDKSNGFPFATLAADGADEYYFSAKDEDGTRNIYHSEKADSLWTAPVLADEKLTSWSDEAFPVLSDDGKTLYFASKGLYGIGGYDLYVSKWDSKEKEWGEPENLGFPYSSPYNDYLFMNSPDGRYSIFASDRECPGTENVVVYVLEFDSMPVRRSVADGADAMNLCNLQVAASSKAKTSQTSGSENSETEKYVLKLREIQALKREIASRQSQIDQVRGDSEKSGWIKEEEAALEEREDALGKASKELQTIEMDLLMDGIVIDPATVLQVSSDNAPDTAYSFERHGFGPDPEIGFMKPKSTFDYSFMILPVGRFAEDNTLPAGLVYQIQIFSRTTSPAKESDLKGLSPVFSRASAGKTIYYAGLFRTYNDVLSNLNKVKRLGFKSATIVAFNNGQSIAVSAARQMEKTTVQRYQIRIRPNGGKLSETDLGAIKSATTKDLVRETQNGQICYILGTYSDSAEASTVVSALKAAGMTDAVLEVCE